MELGLQKCEMLIMRSRIRQKAKGRDLLNQERNRKLEKRKLGSTWENWKWTPSNKWMRKKKIKN